MIVQGPDGKTIDFGDMPEDQVRSAMAELYPTKEETGVGADVVKSAATGLAQGITELATAPYDIGNAAGQYLGKKLVNLVDVDLDPHGTTYKALDAIFGQGGFAEQLPPSLSTALHRAIGVDYEPETAAGRIVQRGAEFAPFMAAFPTKAIQKAPSIASKIAEIAKPSAGAAVGGEIGKGLTEGTEYEPYGELAGSLAGLAGGPAVARGVVGKGQTIAKGATARSPEALEIQAEKMATAAGDLYGKMRDVGAVFNETKTQNIVGSIEKALTDQHFIPELNPKTTAIVGAISKAAEEGSLGLDQLDQYRRLLGRIANTEDGVSAGIVRRTIDDAVNSVKTYDLAQGTEEAVNLLNKGRSEFAKASRFEEIADLVRKADGDANKIKSNFQRFVLNKDLKRMGFNQDEIKAINNAAKNGVGEKLMKMFGKFGIDLGSSLTPGNTALPVLAGMAGTGLGSGPLGAAIIGGGTAARQLQKYLARGKAEEALKLIEGR